MITLDYIDFNYKKKQPLIENLNLTLERGKIYGLLGKNGTGKSTLLKLITGTVFPKSGSITINNIDSREREVEVLSNTFFLSEDYALPKCSIRNYSRLDGVFYPRYDEDIFYSLLEKFEVNPEKQCSDLSLGQAKKVAIAFALATKVDLLILDEPTNGLDIPSKSQLREALLNGFSEHQTVIISTHQVRDLNQLIESVIVLESGRIIFQQSIPSIEDHVSFQQSFSEEKTTDTIYSELMPSGYMHIGPNLSDEPSAVELEVLFNAIIKEPEAINQLF